ncbi:MAG: BON domain-containing protein [Labilithrix sp.]|nr:BON domain-containing protein [Labilithrix sp.]MBX3222644.1 BON domain-containing protein [Labilithrix sp.]
MRKAIVVSLGALALMACSKERQPIENAGITTTRGAEQQQPTASVEEVRTILIEKRPGSAEDINALIISSQGGIITLKGKVMDEATHADLVNRVRAMRNVRGVRDELEVGKKTAAAQHPAHGEQYGTTTTTGGTLPSQPGHEKDKGTTGGTMHQQQGHEKDTTAASKSDAVRKSMEKAHPGSQAVIHALTITDDGQIVTLSGTVPDETTHQRLLKSAKDTPGVKSVKDDLKVEAHKK